MASLVVICFSLITFLAPFALGDEKLSAYQVLEQYSFPIGLLPHGVTGYDLDIKTGKFSAHFNESCSFNIESYELEYEPTIAGVIENSRIKNLKGIRVKVLLLWLNIVEVIQKGDQLEFSVGISSADFPLANFGECPKCGCGFNCNKLSGFWAVS